MPRLVCRESQYRLRPADAHECSSRRIEEIDSVGVDCSKQIDRFPWSGHIGTRMVLEVAEQLEQVTSALIFANTRSQTELWYQSLLKAKPEWAGQLALHHGSLDSAVRRWVEDGLRDHRLRAVVCTSSLDLGVDFTAVDCVFQIGSPKGSARLLQRAGRSGHQPDQTSRLMFVPTNALELIELAAAQDAIKAGKLESRPQWLSPLDVLIQHAVTIAIGGGFDADELLNEVRTASRISHCPIKSGNGCWNSSSTVASRCKRTQSIGVWS